jgi:serine protease Do
MFPRFLMILATLAPAGLLGQAPAPPSPPSPPPLTIIKSTAGQGGSFLGVGVKEIDGERAKALKLREEHGVEITNVQKASPAEKAGLQTGDVVQKYQGQRVEGIEQFVRFVHETPAGRTVKMEVVRAGAPVTVTATLGKREKKISMAPMPPMPPDVRVWMPDLPKPMMSWSSGYLGIEGESLGATQLSGYFGVKEGVLVRSVMEESSADKAGIQAGDVITKVNGAAVTTPREISAALRTARTEDKETFPVTLVREKKEMTLSVTLESAAPPRPARRGRPVSQQ